MKRLLSLASIVLATNAQADQILVDDFSEAAPHAWYSTADQAVNPGSMLGGFRYTEAFGGLTPVTEHGVQTGYSWRDRGSNTGNSWGLATVGQSVIELNLNLGPGGYLSANFLDVCEGLQVRAEVATYVSGSGYAVTSDTWSSPAMTLSHGAQTVNFPLASFQPNGNGVTVHYGNVDWIRLWITQQVGVYPPVGAPAYVLDSMYAVSSVPEPNPLFLTAAGLSIVGFRLRRKAT